MAPDLKTFTLRLLPRLGVPVTPNSVRNLRGWMAAEGGWTHNRAMFNPLNTTQPMPGAGNTGSQGNIKVYRSLNQGVTATERTIENGKYPGIIAALGKDPVTFSRAVNSSPWGTKTDFSGIIRGQKVGPLPASDGISQTQQPSAARQALGGGLTPGSLEAINQYVATSEQDVLAGRMPSDVSPTLAVIRRALDRQMPGDDYRGAGSRFAGAARAVGSAAGSPIAGQAPHAATHQTSGLAGYPAYDYMSPAGTRVGAPVSGTVIKLSGKDPRLGGAPGGPMGYSIYLKGTDGKTYYLTHIDKLAVRVGQQVRQGQQIAVVASGPKSWSSPHVHQGVNG